MISPLVASSASRIGVPTTSVSKSIIKPEVFETKQAIYLAAEEQKVSLIDLDTTFQIENYSISLCKNISFFNKFPINLLNFSI